MDGIVHLIHLGTVLSLASMKYVAFFSEVGKLHELKHSAGGTQVHVYFHSELVDGVKVQLKSLTGARAVLSLAIRLTWCS